MKSVWGKKASVVLCPACRHEILPPKLRSPSGKDTLRAPSKGMVKATDPKVASKKRRQDAKNIREAIANHDFPAMRYLLHGILQEAPSEECEYCLRLMAAA